MLHNSVWQHWSYSSTRSSICSLYFYFTIVSFLSITCTHFSPMKSFIKFTLQPPLSFSIYKYIHLSLPQLRNKLSNTTILFDLVNPVTSNTSAKQQKTHGGLVPDTVHSQRNVINDTRLEPGITVEQKHGRQRSVNNRTRRVDKRVANQRNHPSSNNPFCSPVERTVLLVSGRVDKRIVGSTNNPTRRLRDGSNAPDNRAEGGGLESGLGQSNSKHGEDRLVFLR